MTVDYYKLNQMLILIAAAIPDVVSLFGQTNTSPSMWYAAIDPSNAIFSKPVSKNHQKQFAFSCQDQQSGFTSLPQRYINSLALCHNLVQRPWSGIFRFHKTSNWSYYGTSWTTKLLCNVSFPPDWVLSDSRSHKVGHVQKHPNTEFLIWNHSSDWLAN